MSAQSIPASQTQAETPTTVDRWAADKDHYLQLLREVADTGAETLQLVKQCIRRRARDLQNDAIDPEEKWFMGRITAPLTDPRNKFAQDASSAIDTLSRSIRLTVMLAEKLAHETPTPPCAAVPQPIRREDEAEPHPDVANDDPTTCDNQRQENQRADTESLRPDRPDREFDLAARPVSYHFGEIMREFMRMEAQFQKPLAPQGINNPADAPQAPVKAVPAHRDAPAAQAAQAPTPLNAHQPGPSIPPTPFPRL
jgi:hypothetical protein